jgi:hypothetical protein
LGAEQARADGAGALVVLVVVVVEEERGAQVGAFAVCFRSVAVS